MEDITNPYIAGAPVTETRMFFGREDVFDWIQNNLSGRYADHILVLHGQRRVGKTSVLKQLGNRLPSRYIPVFFDLQGRTHTTLDRFLWWLAREIVRVLKQERGIELPLPEKESFSADLEYFESAFLPDLKPSLGGNILLLTFDEFDNLEESEIKEELARPLIDYFRRMMENQTLNFIFSIGSSGRKLENMQASYTEFFKTALYKKISFLTHDQARRLITQPVEGVIEYERGALEIIYETAFGHPYFTQLICHELFSLCQQTGQRKLGVQDVESILDDVVERGTVNLKFVWDEASDLEKWCLASLATQGKMDVRNLTEYLKKQRVRFTDSDLTSSLLHLSEKDILTSDNRFVIQLLQRWLQKNRPIEQVREELTEVNPIANRYIEIGMEFKDAGVFDKAVESFTDALGIDGDNIQAQVSIAQVYMDQNLHEKAVDEFEKALTMDDEDVVARAGLCEAHLAIGDSSMKKNRMREAVQSYLRVLSMNSEHTEARQRMADLSRMRAEKALTDGRDEEALSAFSEALKYTPEDPTLTARVNSVRAEKKAKVLKSLIARSDKEAADSKWEAARTTLEEAQRLDGEDIQVRERLEVLVRHQRESQLKTLRTRAEKAGEASHWEDAMAAWNAYLELEPTDKTAIFAREKIKESQRQAQLDGLKARARSLVKNEKYNDAIATWDEYLKLDPEDKKKVQGEIEQAKKGRGLAEAYADAQKAFAKKNYDRTINLLKGIVVENADYRDASRLMAQAVELRRTSQKWWKSRWLWIGVGVIGALALAWGGISYGPGILAALQTNSTPSISSSTQLVATPTATHVPLPLKWTRINSAQFLPRDQVNVIAVDPNDPGVLYAGTQSAGIYKSIDGGLSWQPSQIGIGNAGISSLVVKPGNSSVLFAGLSQGGVYRSQNGGATWTHLTQLPDTWWTGSLVVIDPNASQHIFSTADNSLYESTDGGDTWSFKHLFSVFGADGVISIMIQQTDAAGSYMLYVSMQSGNIYISADQGGNWSTVTSLKEHSFFLADPNKNILYSQTKDGGVLLRSDGNGATWETVLSVQGGNLHMVFSTSDVNVGYLTDGTFLYKTIDAGMNWESRFISSAESISSLATHPTNKDVVYLGTRGILMVTGSNSSPENLSKGIGFLRNELLTDPNNGKLFLLEKGYVGDFNNIINVHVSSDAGGNWSALNLGTGSRLSFGADGNIFYSTGSSTLLVSTDGGTSFHTQTLWNSQVGGRVLQANPLIPDTLYLIDPYGDANISLDGGVNWSRLDRSLYRLQFDHNEGKVIYAYGYQPGSGGLTTQVSRSTDGGVSWSDCGSQSLRNITDSETGIAIDYSDNNTLYVALQGAGVLVSRDGCTTWQNSNLGLDNLFINSLAIAPDSPGTVYAGTDGGMYLSSDYGMTWNPVNDGLLGANVVYSIVVDKDSNVYASTPYGIFILEGNP